MKGYVSTRVGLQRVCLLIDTKWGMKPRDNELIDLMERFQTPYQIVLTKADVVFLIDVARRAMQIQEDLKANKSIVDPVMMVSSQSAAGVPNLSVPSMAEWKQLDNTAENTTEKTSELRNVHVHAQKS